MKPNELLYPEQRGPSKAYLVNELRKTVLTWREQGYANTTDTTGRLLKFWFSEDHLISEQETEYSIQENKGEKNFPYINQCVLPTEFWNDTNKVLKVKVE